MSVDFGNDLSCVSDIAADGRTVDGIRCVVEAISRRLSTPRGRLIGDPNYGTDLTGLVNADMSPREIAALRSVLIAECLKDERIIAVEATATLAKSGVLTVTLLCTSALGPFKLTLGVSSVTVEVLNLELS